LKAVTSTNDYTGMLAGAGAKHGTMVIADIQTRGRGRTGSIWISPPGGLWMSIILRPGGRARRLDIIPLMVSLAVVETLRGYGVSGQIKWPNDIMVKDQKLAGILCESSILKDRFRWIIVGIGINVNNLPPELPSLGSKYKGTTMIQIIGKETRLSSLADSIRDSLLRHYHNIQGEGERTILHEYNRQQTLRNRKVRVSLIDHVVEGVAGRVDREGRLSLKSSDGSNYKLRSEEVLQVESL
jgi:BirA family transcriptional regulator, biotin operon repressor / biotin---[acetyl-CoA-carboxylase] ligase